MQKKWHFVQIVDDFGFLVRESQGRSLMRYEYSVNFCVYLHFLCAKLPVMSNGAIAPLNISEIVKIVFREFCAKIDIQSNQ